MLRTRKRKKLKLKQKPKKAKKAKKTEVKASVVEEAPALEIEPEQADEQ
jgi:hypothetical protein